MALLAAGRGWMAVASGELSSGRMKITADVASVGSSTLRRWMDLFCTATIISVKPIYMPATPPDALRLQAVRDQFASRRGIPNVAMACDGSHIPFRPDRCRIRGAANYSPITVTDVQSDGRPLALPGDSPSAPHVCASSVSPTRDDVPLPTAFVPPYIFTSLISC
eukprot:scaffold20445_cov148-Isochrysis_galbana.AAC.1